MANPPEGTYNPQYDAQQGQIQRQYADMGQDYTVGKTRAQDDFQTALGDLGTSRDQALQDVNSSSGRSLADIATARTRAGENLSTALGTVQHNYTVLAGRQAEGARHANVESAGILAEAAAARQANQARDVAPIQTSYDRTIADLGTQGQRVNEDTSTQTGRIGQSYDRNTSKLALAVDRAYGAQGDQTINLARAGRDLNANKLDLSAGRWYDAVANGYAPAPKKKRKVPVII